MNNKKITGQPPLKVTEPTELLKFLLEKFPNKSRNVLKSVLSHRQIMVGNKVITQFNHPLKAGQEVRVSWQKMPEAGTYRGINILFEDQYIIVIEKQAGILSIATEKEKEQTAYSLLSKHVKKKSPRNHIFVVHRLDRDTSGVMMYAKSFKIQQALQKNWQEVVLERTYLAVTEGQLKEQKGTVTSWLTENKANVMFSSPTPNGGQKAITNYEVLKQNREYSLLKVNLETGRKNQIRVHLQELGNSIAGDKKYGAKQNPLNRLGLHAFILSFTHPVTEKVMRFETSIPKQFSRLFKEAD